MADKTAIEWADASWNPIRAQGGGWACVKTSPACAHCYAETLNLLRGNGRPYLPGRHAPPLLDDRVLEQPLRWRRPRRVFVCSMTDVAWDAVPDEWLARIWAVMARTPHHTYLVLTKRPARLADLLGSDRFEREVRWHRDQAVDCPRDDLPWGDVFGHVWVGATVENQRLAEQRVPELLRVPAAVRFLSCEPLLGPLDLGRWLRVPGRESGCVQRRPGLSDVGRHPVNRPELGWVITGGESGGPADRRLVQRCARCRPTGRRAPAPACRDCPVCQGTGWCLKEPAAAWLRSIRDQCAAAGTAFFLKQLGGPTPKAGGRALDGVVWHQYPDGTGYTRPAGEAP